MKDRIGTALWVAGAIICAWALSVSLSMMFDFTIEEARQNFRQGSFIFGAAVVFAFVFRSKVQTWGAFEKFLIYALVPVAQKGRFAVIAKRPFCRPKNRVLI